MLRADINCEDISILIYVPCDDDRRRREFLPTHFNDKLPFPYKAFRIRIRLS